MSKTPDTPGWVELKTLLDQVGMSQIALARATGISPQYINDMIRGRRPAGARARVKIARALKVPQTMLITPAVIKS